MMRGRQAGRTAGWFVLAAAAFCAATASGQNLVANNSFEDAIGAEWTFYGTTDFDQFSGWFGVTAQEGDWFVGAAADGGTKSGGVWQQVTVTPGTGYLFAAWVYSWRSSALQDEPLGRIGYDLTGGTDPGAGTVVWADGVYTDATWVQLGAFFVATGDTVTVFLDMQQLSPAGFNVTAVDNASVVVAETGSVSGVVRDEGMNPLAGVKITTDPYLISATSNPDGTYLLELPTETYTITAALPGYDPAVVVGVVVLSGGSVIQDFVLAEQTCVGFAFANGGFEDGAFPPWIKYGNVGDDLIGPDPWGLGGLPVYEGQKFWGSAINGGSRGTGGRYQHVCVTPGAELTATAASALYWGTSAPQTPDGTRNRIGIDPLGGDNPTSPDIVWSDWDTEANPWTWDWSEISVTTTAVGPKATVFIECHSNNVGGDQWHIHAWDAVTFSEASPAELVVTSIEALPGDQLRIFFEDVGGGSGTYGLASSTAPEGPFADDPTATITDLGGGLIQADVLVGTNEKQFYKGSATP